jgi:hypothetical protein
MITKKISDRVYMVSLPVEWGSGHSKRKFDMRLRIDGRDIDGYRVDVLDAGWCAIDGGYPVPNLEDALALVHRWQAACVEQQTLSPSSASYLVAPVQACGT